MTFPKRGDPIADQASSIGVSPVLLEAIRMASVSLASIVHELKMETGRITVSKETVLGRSLRTVLPLGSSITHDSGSLDLALPAHPGSLSYPYCEAMTLPFMDFPGIVIPETFAVALTGRRLSALVASSCAPLHAVDPVMEEIRNSGPKPELQIILSMEWVSVPIQ